MTLNLKIELLKIFAFELSFSSDKQKKDEEVEEESGVDLLDALKPSTGK